MEANNRLLPKNMRQIGETEERIKIYVEDEVFRFFSQMKMTTEAWRVGVLLGVHEEREGLPCLFIMGAIETKAADYVDGRLKFTDDTWEDVIRRMEAHFPGVGICGWFVYEESGGIVDKLSLKKTHEEAFAHGEKVLLLHDEPGEEAFYMLRKGRLEKMKGYYIYYERNEPMKSYLFGRQRGEAVEEGGSEKVIEDFRAKMEEKKKDQSANLSQLLPAMTWKRLRTASAAAAAVVLMVLMIGYTTGDLGAEDAQEVDSRIEDVQKEETVITRMEEKFQAASSEVKSFLAMQAEALRGEARGEQEEREATDETEEVEQPAEEREESRPSEREKETPSVVSGRPGYLVGNGETLNQICRKLYGNLDRMEEICQLNGIEDPDTILPGQIIYLP